MPLRYREVSRRGHFRVSAEPVLCFSVSFRDVVCECPFEDGSRPFQVALEEANKAEHAASRASFRRSSLDLSFPQENLCCFLRSGILAAHKHSLAIRVIGGKPRRVAFGLPRELGDPREGGLRFLSGEALGPHHRSAIVCLQLKALARGGGAPSSRPRAAAPLHVRHRDRLAEMGERLLERRTAQGLI